MIRIITIVLVIAGCCLAQEVTETEKKVKTIYNRDGRAFLSTAENKGWHKVQGKATLSSGKVTVTINRGTANGKQDVSFIADSTYFGRAWSLDTLSVNKYRIIPLSGVKFMITSDSTNDNSAILYVVEGQ